MLVLAIFSHLCEGFVSVRPSLELLRHFFALRLNARNNQISGCVTFLHAGKEEENFILPNLYSHVKEWRKNLMLVKSLRGSLGYKSPLLRRQNTVGGRATPQEMPLSQCSSASSSSRRRGLTGAW